MHAMCINAFRKWKTSGKNQKIRDHYELLEERKHSELVKFSNSIETYEQQLLAITGAFTELNALRLYESECINLKAKAF